MLHKFLLKSELIQERKKLLKIVYTESEANKLLKMRHFLTDLGMRFYIWRLFSKVFWYKVVSKFSKKYIYMNRTYNTLDYHLFIYVSKNKLSPVTSIDIENFERNIFIHKWVITKVYISISWFSSKAKNKANSLWIILFTPNEILWLEKKMPIERFITKCRKKRLWKKYIYEISLLDETKSSQFINNITKNICSILENKRIALISKTQDDIKLLLKEVRNLIARENQIQSYMVFSNKTLNEIIRKRPSTNRELSDISWIETYIIERYGSIIIRVVI